jgi:serine/threonine protein kinase/WD40 repeat protein
MSTERRERVDALSLEALSKAGRDRAVFLEQACGGDADLRREVERLLAGQQEAGEFLETPAFVTASVQPLAPGTRLGPYEIVAAAGAGGMGEVYKARDTRLDRIVAIKVIAGVAAMDSSARERFTREARAIASLNHPHICALYDVGDHEGQMFLVMEHLAGQTLAQRLEKGALPLKQVLTIASEIAEALSAAHRQGVVHRDLKPANVMVTKSGAKLLDFGLAKLTGHGDQAAAACGLSIAPTESAPLTGEGVIVGTLPYMAPEQLEGKPPDARTDLWALGAILYEMLTGKRPFEATSAVGVMTAIMEREPPSIASLQPLTPPSLDRVVRSCLEKDPDARWQAASDVARELHWIIKDLSGESRPSRGFAPAVTAGDSAPAGATTLVDVEERCPYPGLRSFSEQDAKVFFGREEEIRAAWSRIPARPLLAVIGPSGAGKTSFLRAGVVAGRPDGWAALVCTPGTSPLRALGQALASELRNDVDALRQLVSFEEPDVAFALLRRWRQAHDAGLIAFDQFEELFTLNPPETQARIASLLGRLAAEADIHIVLSLRDDFLMRCHDHAPLASVFSELMPLGVLTRADLRRAVVEPARKLGYVLEDEALVDEMVESVEGAKAALPLLAFALARLWDSRDRERRLLTRAEYERIGGVAGALAQHAEATLDRIGSFQQDVVRELFRNLVTAHGTRAVVDRDELLSVIPERAAAETVLRELVDARLLTSYELEGKPGETGRHRVEIAHESLLSAWPRLVRWRTQDEDGAQVRDQLKQAAHLWEEKNRTRDLLWTGTAFQEYSLWRERYPGALTSVEEAFAHAMTQRELRRRRLRRAAVAAVIVALGAVAVAIGISRQQAARARDAAYAAARRAEAGNLMVLAERRLADDPTEAVLLAGASLEQADTRAAREFVMRVLWDTPLAFELIGDQSLRTPAFSPDGKWLAAAGQQTTARVWSEDGRASIALSGLDTNPRGTNLARWISNDMLVTGLHGKLGRSVQLWSLPEGRRIRTVDFDEPSFWQVGPHRLLAQIPSGSSVVQLRSWDLPDGEPLDLGEVDTSKLGTTATLFEPPGRALLYVKGRGVYARPLPVGAGRDQLLDRLGAALWNHDADLNRVAFGDETGEFRIWRYGHDRVPDQWVVRRPGPPGAARFPNKADPWVAGMFPESSRRWMIENAAQGQSIRVWDLAAWPDARPLQLRRTASWYGAVTAAHPTGTWLVASTSRFTHLTFWPLGRPYSHIVDGYSAMLRPLAFSPNGKWLVSGWGDQVLRLWPLPGSAATEVRRLELPEPITTALWNQAITFDPVGRYVVVVGTGRVWVVPVDGSPPRRLATESPDTLFRAVAVSPSGRRVATAYYYGPGARTLRVWDLGSATMKQFDLPAAETPPRSTGPGLPAAYDRGIEGLAFSGESTLLSAGDGGLRRWDLETGRHELLFAVPHGAFPSRARFSTDGRLALFREWEGSPEKRRSGVLYDIRAGTSTQLPSAFGAPASVLCETIDPSGRVVATGSEDGVIRVGWLDGEPHILVGHKGAVTFVAISPDLQWVASTGEDNTLRLWPMPNLDAPPLHALPLDQLLAKLRTLTNLRAARDAAAPTGWRIEVGPFPGWRTVPTW